MTTLILRSYVYFLCRCFGKVFFLTIQWIQIIFKHWFGLVSLYNDISTFVTYFMPSLLKNRSAIIKPTAGGRRARSFHKCMGPKVNIIVWLEVELAYYTVVCLPLGLKDSPDVCVLLIGVIQVLLLRFRVSLGLMAMKSSELEPHHRGEFSVISRTPLFLLLRCKSMYFKSR